MDIPKNPGKKWSTILYCPVYFIGLFVEKTVVSAVKAGERTCEERCDQGIAKIDGIVGEGAFSFEGGAEEGVGEVAEEAGEDDDAG